MHRRQKKRFIFCKSILHVHLSIGQLTVRELSILSTMLQRNTESIGTQDSTKTQEFLPWIAWTSLWQEAASHSQLVADHVDLVPDSTSAFLLLAEIMTFQGFLSLQEPNLDAKLHEGSINIEKGANYSVIWNKSQLPS